MPARKLLGISLLLVTMVAACAQVQPTRGTEAANVPNPVPTSPAVGMAILQHEDARSAETGIPYRRYFISNHNVHAGYVNNPFYFDGDDFLFCSDYADGLNLFRHQQTQDTQITQEHGLDLYANANFLGCSPVIVGDTAYYILGRAIYAYDARTHAVTKVTEVAPDETLWAPLHATRDGKWLSATLSVGNDSSVARINVGSGQVDRLPSPFLGGENPIANHAQVHPLDPNIVMFAHDGSWVLDRIWLWNPSTGERHGFNEQPPYTVVGHEFWYPDGTGVYAVQYGSPPRGILSGFNFYDRQGNLTEVYKTDTLYFSHASLSPNQKYLVADTYRPDGEDRYWVVLYDRENKILTKVSTVSWSSHPAHPHPFWSPEGDRFMFNTLQGGLLELREVKLADVLSRH